VVLTLLRDLRSYYQGSGGRNQGEFYDLESRLPYFDQVNWILGRHKQRIMIEFLDPPQRPGDPILEVGCGIGTFARALAARAERVVAVDISRRKVARARALTAGSSAERIEYHAGDFRDLGSGGALDQALFAGGPLAFSRIIASDVVEHVPSEPIETGRRLRNLLKPGGQLLVSVPSRLCLSDPGHIWRLLPAGWEAVFAAAGLEVRRRRMSRISWYRLPTPLPLAMVFDLRRSETS